MVTIKEFDQQLIITKHVFPYTIPLKTLSKQAAFVTAATSPTRKLESPLLAAIKVVYTPPPPSLPPTEEPTSLCYGEQTNNVGCQCYPFSGGCFGQA